MVPEFRDGRPVRLVGRILEQRTHTTEDGEQQPAKYVALRGSQPLLGAELARGSATSIVVEGVFDHIMLDPDSIATVFAVTSPDNTTKLIDLLSEDPGGLLRAAG